MALIKINAGGFDGETGIITFFPCSGGTINLGTHIMPYFYDTDYFLGVYSIYFPTLLKTCTTEIPCTYNNVILKINNQDFKQYECGELDNIDILNSQLLSVGVLEPGNERVLIPDSNIRLKNTSGILILNDTVEAAGNGIIVAPDGTYRNSDSTFTDSVNSGELNKLIPNIDLNVNSTLEGSIPSVKDIDIELEDGSSNTITPTNVTMVGDVLTIEIPIFGPDTIYTIEDTLGNILYSGITLSGLPFNQTIDNSIIENRDASYSVNVLAEDSLTLPDSQINVNSVDSGDVVSVKTIDVNITDGVDPVTPTSVGLVGNTLTIEVPSGGGSYDLDLVDRFGNAFPTKQVTANATWDLRTLTPFDFADLFLSQMDTTPTSDEEDYIEYIVDQYVAAGLWNKMYLIRPYVGSSSNNNALNLRYPFKNRSSQYAIFVGSPTHNANGITHSGNSYELSYLDGSVLLDLNWHMSLYSRTDTNPNSAGATDMAFSNDLNYASFEIKSTATRCLFRGQNTTTLINPPPTSDGLFTLNCLSGTNNTKFIKNASTLIGAITSASFPTGNPRMLTIGAPPEDGTINYTARAARATNRNFAMATVGDGLTDTEISNKYAIDQAAQTIMSRQV